jgi:hypothetical protein
MTHQKRFTVYYAAGFLEITEKFSSYIHLGDVKLAAGPA